MGIVFNEKKRIFTLYTKHTMYQMMADGHGVLLHLYYGRRIQGEMDYLLTYHDRGFSGNPADVYPDRSYSLMPCLRNFPSGETEISETVPCRWKMEMAV